MAALDAWLSSQVEWYVILIASKLVQPLASLVIAARRARGTLLPPEESRKAHAWL